MSANPGVQPCITDDAKKVQPNSYVKIRISLFFDGTTNNRTNVSVGKHHNRVLSEQVCHVDNKAASTASAENLNAAQYEEKSTLFSKMMLDPKFDVANYLNFGLLGGYIVKEKVRPFVNESYTLNDYTNIVKLEKYLKKESEGYDFHEKIYIEGVGTEDFQIDGAIGFAIGRGSTGIIAKVEKAILLVLNTIKSLVDIAEGKTIEEICLDAFGFSRGAAAARHFVHKAKVDENTNIKSRLQYMGYDIGKLEVKFIGLFDTVAAYGLGHDNILRFENSHKSNIDELYLNAVVDVAKTIVHITAKDEYRKNFPLTLCTSNFKTLTLDALGSQASVLEIELPGAHSDIGGGYRDIENEELPILDFEDEIDKQEDDALRKFLFTLRHVKERFKKELDWLISEGWIDKDEDSQKVSLDLSSGTNNAKVILKRNNIRNTYSRIPLHIMKNHAEKSGLSFDETMKVDEPIVPDDLPEEDKEILASFMKKLGSEGLGAPNVEKELIRKLKRRFFHFSAHYGRAFGAFAPKFDNDDFWNKSRKRDIYPESNTDLVDPT